MNDIARVYEIMSSWHSRLLEVECISVFVFSDEMRIRIDWRGDEERAVYTKIFTKEELESIPVFDNLDEAWLMDVENKYKIWEVGEE